MMPMNVLWGIEVGRRLINHARAAVTHEASDPAGWKTEPIDEPHWKIRHTSLAEPDNEWSLFSYCPRFELAPT